jgi:hypothetical protein
MARQEAVQLKPTPGTSIESVSVSLPNAGRSYKNIKEALVDLPEITESIKAKTGWNVDISKISLQVVTQKELVRRCSEDIKRRTGIPEADPNTFLSRTLSDALLYSVHTGTLALYLPSEKTIVINENFRRLSKDAMKSTLHHELTHAAQDQAYPEFMQRIARLARELKLLQKHGADLPADERTRKEKDVADRVQARMSLIEGQAVTLQRMYEREFGLHPDIKMGPVEVAFGLSALLLPGSVKKALQYIQGAETFKKIHALGLESVQELFRDPKYTDLVFGPEKPKKVAA